ncbi:hypothetical protein C8F01DRAFT_236369 [Mycena amicta]|nr:hypothetical protein C8F01DRAFT_236369 [Mycena amicta]
MAPKKTAPNTTKKGPQGSILNFFPRVSQAQSSSPAPLKAQEVVVRVSDASMPDGPSSRVPANSQPPFKRKAKPDSDSEAEPNDAVAHLSRRSPARSCIPSPTKSDKENINPPRKKPRTASPCPSPNPPVDDEPVPSSQSDEDELMPVHSTTDNTVDPPRPSTPEQAPGHQQVPLRTPQQKHLMSPLPATPVALTPRTKTAQIIADIKARAQAQAAACP